MKRVLIAGILILLLLAALSALTIAAARNGMLAQFVVTPTVTNTIAPTAQSTLTPTPPSTDTPRPTPTPTIAATATPTRSPTPSVTPTSSATPLKLTVKLELSTNKIEQGHAFLVKLTSSRPLVNASVTIDNRVITLQANNGAWWSVFAFSRFANIAPLGKRTATARGSDAQGNVASDSATVELVAADFITEKVKGVPTAFDPSDYNREEQIVAPIRSALTPKQLWNGLFARPVSTGTITSEYGETIIWEDNSSSSHEGTDFGGLSVGAPIFAANDGVVVLAQRLVVRGNAVVIDHGLGVHTGYYHMSEIVVKKGDDVKKGQLIGKLGDTGRVTGAHLHWDFMINGLNADPMEWTTKLFTTAP